MRYGSARVVNIVIETVLEAVADGISILEGPIARTIVPAVQALVGASPLKATSITQALRRLEQRGLVQRVSANRQAKLELTSKGRQRLERVWVDDLQLPPTQEQWDGKWRIVLFDIPEERKYLRTVFRRKLQQLGFVYMQRSAWVIPHKCEDVLTQLIQRLSIENHVQLLVADQVSNDATLLRRFRLSAVEEGESVERLVTATAVAVSYSEPAKPTEIAATVEELLPIEELT